MQAVFAKFKYSPDSPQQSINIKNNKNKPLTH